MAVQKATFTGTNGQAATASNTSMAALSVTGGTMAFTNAWLPRGVVALRGTGTTANGSVYARQALGGSSMGVAYEVPLSQEVRTTATDDSFLRLGSSNAGVRNVEFGVNQNGALTLRDNPFVIRWQSADNILPVNGRCLFSTYVTVSGTAGTVRIVLYAEDEVTVLVDSGTITGLNTGTAAIDSARTIGPKVGSSTRTPVMLFGEPRWDLAATGIMPTMYVPPNQAPTAAYTHTVSGLTLNVNGSGSTDPDGTITQYAWDWGVGAGFQVGSATTSYTYPSAGTRTVTLRVTDDDGATDTEAKSITVVSPPTASFTYTTDDLAVSVNGSGSSDPDGTITQYEWNYGEGAGYAVGTATGTHTYAAAGTYTVTLRVTDSQGLTATSSQSVTVTDPPPPPAPTSPGSVWYNGQYVDVGFSRWTPSGYEDLEATYEP